MTIAVSWTLWQTELKDPRPLYERTTRDTSDPHMTAGQLEATGYWRMLAGKTRVSWPIAIWTEADEEKNPNGVTMFQRGNERPKNTGDHAEQWHNFMQKGWLKCVAITRDEWAKALETGFWPDKLAAKEMTIEELLGISIPTEGGGNMAPLSEQYADQIKNLAEKMEAHEVTDQDSANDATAMADIMRRLLDLAEAERVKEKEPFLQGGRDVDGKWKAVRDPGLDAKARIERLRDTWLREEQKRANERAAEETRRQQEQALAAHKVAEQQAEQMGMEAPPPPVVEPVQAEKVKAGSATGRAVSAKTVMETRVVEPANLASYFLYGTEGVEPDELFHAYLLDRAKKAVKAKVNLPGVLTMSVDDWVKWEAEQASKAAAAKAAEGQQK